MKTIERYSIGAGDRFGHQGAAQIAAFKKAREKGVDVAIVWNKSNREHLLTGTEPADQRAAAALIAAASRRAGMPLAAGSFACFAAKASMASGAALLPM